MTLLLATNNLTGAFIAIVVFSLVALMGILYNMHKESQMDLLDTMYKNGDIDSDTFTKYLNKL